MSEGKTQSQWPSYIDEKYRSTIGLLISGGVAGCIAKTVTAPLSRLTILFQVHSMVTTKPHAPQYADSMLAAFRKVVGKEGFLAFWKGNGTSVIHRFPYSAINFTVFEWSKRFFTVYTGEKDGDVAYNKMGLIRFISGAVAGATATASCYPLDLVRTRLTTQVANTPQNYNGIVHALWRIARDEGMFGLYNGLGVTLSVQVPNLAISYSTYGFFRDHMMEWLHKRQNEQARLCLEEASDKQHTHQLAKLHRRHTPVEAFLGDSDVPASGIVDDEDEDDDNNDDEGKQTKSCVKLMNKGEAGLGNKNDTLLKYEVNSTNDSELKKYHQQPIDHSIQMLVNMGCGALSGISATLIIYPLDVIRRRMQLQGLHRTKELRHSALTEARLIIAGEGIAGLYRGLTPELCKIIPMVSITFCVYESLKEAFEKEDELSDESYSK